MHNFVPNLSNFFEQAYENQTINLQVKLAPNLRVLKESNVLTKCKVRYIFQRAFGRRFLE